MKKEKELSPKIKRQIEIISKYYDVDFEKRIINLELHYKSVDDLFVDDFVGKGLPTFKNEILARVSEIMESFPTEFKADVKLVIDDYKGMDPEIIFESFQDSLEMFNYSVHKEKSIRWLEAVALALISVGILFLRKLGLNNKILEDSMLLTEMLDITAWVFLWQAVTILFLNQDTFNNVSFKIISRMKSFSLLDNNHGVVKFASQEEISKNWVQISKRETTSRKLLIIAGAISFATGVTNGANLISVLLTPGVFSDALTIIATSILFADVAIGIIGGIGAISLFRENGHFQKAVPIIAIIYLLVDIALVSLSIFVVAGQPFTASQVVSYIVQMLMTMGASLLYFISYVVLSRVRHLDRVKYAKKSSND